MFVELKKFALTESDWAVLETFRDTLLVSFVN